MKEEEINFDEEIALIPVPKPIQKLIDVKLINNVPIKMEKKKMSTIQMNKYGVDNLKKVGIAIASLVDAGIKSHSDDGKITLGDFAHFIKVVPNMLSAIPAISHLKNELGDVITDEELKDFNDTVLPHLGISNELDKEFIAGLLDVVRDISRLISNRLESRK